MANGTNSTLNYSGMLNVDGSAQTATGTDATGGQGNGGTATLNASGNIFKPLGPSFTFSGTSTGGNGAGTGNGGNATSTVSGNILSTSTSLTSIELDSIAKAGTNGGGTGKYGNATATLSGNIVTYTNATATNVILNAQAYANGADATTNNGNSAFGTKTATVSGNIVTGNVNSFTIDADAFWSNATATISGNIFTAKPADTGTVTLEARGQTTAITGNILNLGKQNVTVELDQLGPTYKSTFAGNIFNGTGTNILTLDETQTPTGPSVDSAVFNLGAHTLTFNGQTNIINNFAGFALAGNANGTFIGTSGNDTLNAGTSTTTGTIIFQGNGGTDMITGGPLALNVADFAGAEWQYGTATLTSVIGGPLGNTSNDTLSGIQRLKFLSPSHVSDINNDGYGDLIFQDSGTKEVEFQLQPGGPDVQLTPSITGTWKAIGTGQFTADTDRKAGILLQDTSSGDLEVLTGINPGTGVYTATALSTQPGSANWKAITAGDFNGDAASDILLQNTSTGAVEIDFLNTSFGQLTGTVDSTNAVTTPGANWNAISSGDFNGDGDSDILWQNSTTGAVDISLMTGATGTPTAIGSGTGFTVVGSGDFNGDGKSDILLRNNSTGDAQIWLMNGTTQVGPAINVTGPGAGWTLLGAEDVNKDGYSDLLWQQTSTGTVDVQLMTTGATPLLGLTAIGTPLASTYGLVASTGGG